MSFNAYIGEILVDATPMTRREMCKLYNLNPNEYVDLDRNGYLIKTYDNYKYWTTEEAFNKNYRRANNMTFGEALEEMKKGHKCMRAGWPSNRMVGYQKGYPEGIPCNKQTAECWGLEEGDMFRCLPYLQLKRGDGAFEMYTPSQNDMLSGDWLIVLMKGEEE